MPSHAIDRMICGDKLTNVVILLAWNATLAIHRSMQVALYKEGRNWYAIGWQDAIFQAYYTDYLIELVRMTFRDWFRISYH